jgi:hypothetical protein
MVARIGNTEAARQILVRIQDQGHRPYVFLAANLLAGEIEQSSGNVSKALTYFRTAREFTVPWSSREWFARSLIAAKMNSEADHVASQLLATPFSELYYVQRWPGIWADSFAEFAFRTELPRDRFCVYASRYLALRSSADTELRATEVSKIRNDFEQSCH